MRRLIGLAALLVVLGATGCGGGGSSSAASTTAGGAPADLLGTYRMTLKASDIPASKPPEITDASPRWILIIADSGGVDNGPTFTLASENLGTLESSSFSVSGDSVLLHDEECGNGKPVESEYRYSLDGSTLTFTTVKNGCPDGVAEALLTSEPWQKQSSGGTDTTDASVEP
jgi:hypothetical protein